MRNPDARELLNLVYEVNRYDKSRQDWEALLERLRKLIRADFAVAVERFPTLADRGLIYSAGSEKKHLHRYQCEVFRFDEEKLHSRNARFPKATLISSSKDKYNELLAAFKVDCGLLLDCIVDGDILLRLFVGRSNPSVIFSREEISLFDILGEHLIQALKNQVCLQTPKIEADFLMSALEVIPVPTLIVDHDLRINYGNAKSYRILDKAEELCEASGKLILHPDMESCFRQAFHSILKKPVQKEDSHSEVLRVGRYQLLLRRVCSRERDGYIAIFLFDGDEPILTSPVSL